MKLLDSYVHTTHPLWELFVKRAPRLHTVIDFLTVLVDGLTSHYKNPTNEYWWNELYNKSGYRTALLSSIRDRYYILSHPIAHRTVLIFSSILFN
jgi:hypothetical protein